MFELTRKVLSGTVLAAITGGVLLWGLSPGMTLKREYESYNGKPAGSEHTLQAITFRHMQRAGSDSIGSLYTARRHIGAGVSDLPILPQPDAGAAGRCRSDRYKSVLLYT